MNSIGMPRINTAIRVARKSHIMDLEKKNLRGKKHLFTGHGHIFHIGIECSGTLSKEV